MKINMSLDGDRFLARESILLKIGLENTSPGVVDIPNPEDVRNPQFGYSIIGPAFPHGFTFKPRINLPNPNAPTLLKMGPGEKLLVQLPLDRMFGFTQPGQYMLTVHYAWGDQKASFGPISFIVQDGRLKSARIMADDGLQEPILQRVLGLVGDPPVLYQFFFQEQRPDIGEIVLTEMIRAAAAAADARQSIPLWTNFERSEVFFARFGWQSPGAIGIESGPPEQSVRLALPAESTAIAPALMTRDGITTVFSFSPAGLSLGSFPLPVRGAPVPAATVRWTAPVPAIRGAAAALGPPPRNLAFAVTLTQTGTGAEVRLFGGGDGGRARIAEVKGARVLPGSQPALWIDDRGEAHAAALFAEDNLFRRVFLANLTWSSGSGSAGIERQPTVQMPSPVRAATAAFSVAKVRPPRLNWVILLEDGSLRNSRAPAEPHHPTRAPLLPLQLLGTRDNTYLLVADPMDLLGFELLH